MKPSRIVQTKLALAPGVTRSTKALSAAGVLAAFVIAILVNVWSARHYKRWDATSSKLYTLSAATLETLHHLEQNVQIEVLLSSSDPLERSVSNMLQAYGGETRRLEVHYVDPDRHPAEFVAAQQKYGIVAGRTEEGRVVTDAAIVVASGERHWFITADDMVEFGETGEARPQSKIEQALTGGIRAVQAGEKLRLCFSAGHGEFSPEDNAEQGLGEFRERLEKNNYQLQTVDSTKPNVREPFKDCDVLFVVAPSLGFSQPEADQIGARMRAGMSGVFLLNPILDPDKKLQLDTGLEPVTKLFGIGLAKDYVFEQNEAYRIPKGVGEVFFPELQAHPITQGLIGAANAGLRVVLMRSRSLMPVPAEVQPSTLMSTSAQAFGMLNFFDWIEKGGEPQKGAQDRSGPLAVGLAAELPKPSGSEQAHGPRLVVLGTASPVLAVNWRDPALRGNAVLAGNIVSWVAARPPILDVPAKEATAANLHITEESLGEVMRYVLLFMPGAAALLGVAVYMRRRSSPRAQPASSSPKKPA